MKATLIKAVFTTTLSFGIFPQTVVFAENPPESQPANEQEYEKAIERGLQDFQAIVFDQYIEDKSEDGLSQKMLTPAGRESEKALISTKLKRFTELADAGVSKTDITAFHIQQPDFADSMVTAEMIGLAFRSAAGELNATEILDRRSKDRNLMISSNAKIAQILVEFWSTNKDFSKWSDLQTKLFEAARADADTFLTMNVVGGLLKRSIEGARKNLDPATREDLDTVVLGIQDAVKQSEMARQHQIDHPFNIEGTDIKTNQAFDTQSLKGKVVVVLFFANEEFTRDNLPSIRHLLKTSDPTRVELVGVCMGANVTDANIMQVIKNAGLADQRQLKLAPDKERGFEATPTAALIDQKGILKGYYVGRAIDQELERSVKKLLKD